MKNEVRAVTALYTGRSKSILIPHKYVEPCTPSRPPHLCIRRPFSVCFHYSDTEKFFQTVFRVVVVPDNSYRESTSFRLVVHFSFLG